MKSALQSTSPPCILYIADFCYAGKLLTEHVLGYLQQQTMLCTPLAHSKCPPVPVLWHILTCCSLPAQHSALSVQCLHY